MATNISFQIGVPGAREYRVVEMDGCALIYGAITATAASRLFKGFPKGAVLDQDLARMAEANFAIGKPKDTALLREKLTPAAIARTRAKYAESGLSEAVIRWLAIGEHGSSSLAVFSALTGINVTGHEPLRPIHPGDPGDLRRCRLLLEQAPELTERLQTMSDLSEVWARIVERWNELCATMDAECPKWRESGGTATKTYELMKAIGC